MSRILLLLLLAATGCTSSYEWVRGALPPGKLEARPVYVAVPASGSFETKVYPESGQQTADALYAALGAVTSRVLRGTQTEDHEAAVRRARELGAGYVVYPTILHWEDRATEWSSLPDRIQIRLDLIDVATGSVLDSSSFSGKSKITSFGGDHPQDLLHEPLLEYARRLF